MFTFANAILFLGAAQGLILAGLLLFKRRVLLAANRILATILVILSLSILLHAVSQVGVFPLAQNHKVLISLLMILNAPLVYLYSVAMTVYRFQIEKKHVIHMLPFGIGLLLSFSLLINADNLPIQVKLTRALIVLTFAVIIVYIIAANFVLLRHARVIRSNFSSLQRINLNWLRMFVGSLTLFWLFAAIFDIFFKAASWMWCGEHGFTVHQFPDDFCRACSIRHWVCSDLLG